MTNKPIAVFDIDGTLFRWQLFHELVFKLSEKGYLPPDVSESLNIAFKDWRGLKASWADYEDKVVSAIENNITNISPKDFENAAQEVVEASGHKVYAYTANLALNLKNKGYYLLAITGSNQEIAEIFANKHGFDDCIGALQNRNHKGEFDGTYARSTYNQKGKILLDYVNSNKLTLKGSYAVGDSSGDIDTLNLVDNPIAFNPSQELLEAAMQHGWPIVIERKNIVYTLTKKSNQYVLSDTKIF